MPNDKNDEIVEKEKEKDKKPEKKVMIPQWKGGCVNCGGRRNLNDRHGIPTQIYLLRDDGNKTIVGLCESCYASDKLDYNQISINLAASEIECAEMSGKPELINHAAGFKDLKFKGYVK